jgi:hypothetical protein
MKKHVQKIKAWSRPKKVALGIGTFIILAIAVSGGNHNQANLNSTPTNNKSAAQAQHKPTVTTKTETETQVIPYESTTVNDSNLAKGTTKITTAGVNGSQTLTYKVTYTDGRQTAKKLVNTTVTAKPITQVTAVGTYVAAPAPSCSNGSYINSAGNRVCSPSSNPSGATAQCGDGSYSYSQSRSGTCSHHGGVAAWL